MSFSEIPKNDIDLQQQLGSGAFGVVYKAKWKSKNRVVACKCIVLKPDGSSKQTADMIIKEIYGYVKCAGLFILPFYGYFYDIPSLSSARFFIVMEYMSNGSLTNFLQKEYHRLTLRRKLSIACDIASGMHRIHRHGIIHRDIRPDNILIDTNYRAKIGDMGIAEGFQI
ncbi:unnamed protein product [Adineta ricciae]|uniref:Protein kinase domain-containing protein n=1 Tax=Adineta ricciae TaxID=249248 RepID=A0A814H8R6_ADIRI|nr:unnamed protein product [Adineta ricciae]CAF1160317.1 unnamed protein product [Adineta ricciae]